MPGLHLGTMDPHHHPTPYGEQIYSQGQQLCAKCVGWLGEGRESKDRFSDPTVRTMRWESRDRGVLILPLQQTLRPIGGFLWWISAAAGAQVMCLMLFPSSGHGGCCPADLWRVSQPVLGFPVGMVFAWCHCSATGQAKGDP